MRHQPGVEPADERDPERAATAGEEEVAVGEDVAVELERLDVILTQIKEQRGVQNVYLQADEGVPYGFVAEIMGRIRSTGLTRLGLVTEPPVKS